MVLGQYPLTSEKEMKLYDQIFISLFFFFLVKTPLMSVTKHGNYKAAACLK